jgi:hypothetical protein
MIGLRLDCRGQGMSRLALDKLVCLAADSVIPSFDCGDSVLKPFADLMQQTGQGAAGEIKTGDRISSYAYSARADRVEKPSHCRFSAKIPPFDCQWSGGDYFFSCTFCICL